MLNIFSITSIYIPYLDINQFSLFGSVVRTIYHRLKESNDSGVGDILCFYDVPSNPLLDLIPGRI